MSFKKTKMVIGAFLAGEIITLFYKDEKMKAKLKEQNTSFDKCKVVLNGLIDLNKKIFTEVQEYDYAETYKDIQSFVNREKENIEGKLIELKEDFDELNDETIKPMIDELENRIEVMKNKIDNKVDEKQKEYELNEKVEKLKDQLSTVKEKFTSQ